MTELRVKSIKLYNTSILPIHGNITVGTCYSSVVNSNNIESNTITTLGLNTNTLSLPFASFDKTFIQLYNHCKFTPDKAQFKHIDASQLNTYNLQSNQVASNHLRSNHVISDTAQFSSGTINILTCSLGEFNTISSEHLSAKDAKIDKISTNHIQTNFVSVAENIMSGLGSIVAPQYFNILIGQDPAVEISSNMNIRVPVFSVGIHNQGEIHTDSIKTRAFNSSFIHARESCTLSNFILSHSTIQTDNDLLNLNVSTIHFPKNVLLDSQSIRMPHSLSVQDSIQTNEIKCQQLQTSRVSLNDLFNLDPFELLSQVPCFTLRGMDNVCIDTSFIQLGNHLTLNDSHILTDLPLYAPHLHSSCSNIQMMTFEHAKGTVVECSKFTSHELYTKDIFSNDIQTSSLQTHSINIEDTKLSWKSEPLLEWNIDFVQSNKPIHVSSIETTHVESETITTSNLVSTKIQNDTSLETNDIQVLNNGYIGNDLYVQGTLHALGKTIHTNEIHNTMEQLALKSSSLHHNGVWFERDPLDITTDVPLFQETLAELAQNNHEFILNKKGHWVGHWIKIAGFLCNNVIRQIVKQQGNVMTLNEPFNDNAKPLAGDVVYIYGSSKHGMIWSPSKNRIEFVSATINEQGHDVIYGQPNIGLGNIIYKQTRDFAQETRVLDIDLKTHKAILLEVLCIDKDHINIEKTFIYSQNNEWLIQGKHGSHVSIRKNKLYLHELSNVTITIFQ